MAVWLIYVMWQPYVFSDFMSNVCSDMEVDTGFETKLKQ